MTKRRYRGSVQLARIVRSGSSLLEPLGHVIAVKQEDENMDSIISGSSSELTNPPSDFEVGAVDLRTSRVHGHSESELVAASGTQA